jgi:tRNA U34 2-thiouridine synthase MnmA/TrmU
MIPSRKSKAVGLFSGGLDSILATKLITEQGVTVVALHYRLPFGVPGQGPTDEKLSKMASLVGASLMTLDADESYLQLVKTPQFGHVKQLAPCIDCVVLMLAKAKELAKEIKADFVFTGEVVGQRAICQNKRTLKQIEKAVGLEGRLLRPLSAKLLEPTIPELTGLVRRERLLDLKGRSRRRQIRLAHEFGIFDYPIPGTGCMLLDKNFAARVRDAVKQDQLALPEVELLKYGRHFRLDSGAKVVVGRNEAENRRLEELALEDDTLCKPVEIMGPVTILRSQKRTKKDTEIAARITARYSDAPAGKAVKLECAGKTLSVKPYKDEDFAAWRVQYQEIKPTESAPVPKPETETAKKPRGKKSR